MSGAPTTPTQSQDRPDTTHNKQPQPRDNQGRFYFLSSIKNTSASRFNTFSLTDNFGNSYLFVRSLAKRKGFFNIAKCEVLAKDKSVPKGYAGIILEATWFSDEEVAELVAKSEEYNKRLERAEASLREWIDLRNTWARKGKRKLPIQKKEAKI